MHGVLFWWPAQGVSISDTQIILAFSNDFYKLKLALWANQL